jgi:hypothetical protein
MKKITSLTLAISFLVMTYSGIMLFLCPHGRVAYWSNWHLWGLSKNQYGDIHTTSMIIFVLFGMLHVYYNWKPIVSYMKNSQKKISFTKKEFLIALLINVIFITGTLFATGPFKLFLDFEESIKDSWTKTYGEPPYGHAEESKLSVFCKKMDIELDRAKDILSKNNIIYKENQTLKTIADNNNVTPSYIYELIKNDKNDLKSEEIPSSLGRKTLKELNDMKKIELKKSLIMLKSKGLKDVTKDSRIKNIADELDITPLELYQFLTGSEK